jgi:hypothetical protein
MIDFSPYHHQHHHYYSRYSSSSFKLSNATTIIKAFYSASQLASTNHAITPIITPLCS